MTHRIGGVRPGRSRFRLWAIVLLVTLCLAILAGGHRTAFAESGLTLTDDPAGELPPRVLSYSPEADATQVPLDTSIAVTWSKPMSPDSRFFVLGPYGFVHGVYSYDPLSYTVTFVPGAELRPATRYGVLVIGQSDAAGHLQREAIEWSFRTIEPLPAQLSEFSQEDGLEGNRLWSAWPWLMLLVAAIFLAGFIWNIRGTKGPAG